MKSAFLFDTDCGNAFFFGVFQGLIGTSRGAFDISNQKLRMFDDPLIALCDRCFEMAFFGKWKQNLIIILSVIKLVLGVIGKNEGQGTVVISQSPLCALDGRRRRNVKISVSAYIKFYVFLLL